jgi:hypothetical protein
VWRPFRKSSAAASADATWWRDASEIAGAPTEAAIAALEQRATFDPIEDADRQREMIAGLRQLAEIAASADLPAVVTQHRVIGSDTCHFIGPASRVGGTDSSGKLFLTSTRLVLVTGAVASWPWHRVTSVARVDRDVIFSVSGGDAVHVRLNTFGEALVVHHLAERLSSRRTSGSHAGQSRI